MRALVPEAAATPTISNDTLQAVGRLCCLSVPSATSRQAHSTHLDQLNNIFAVVGRR